MYLIGVDHSVQWNDKLSLTKDFKHYLAQKIKELKIGLIAEEFSQEAIEINGVKKTTTQEVTNSFNIQHKLCDPDSKKRKELGILLREEVQKKLKIRGPVFFNSEQDKRINKELKKYHFIREQFWVDQIKDELFATILFVCGADHLKSFQSLLLRSGYNTTILTKNFNSL